MLRNRLFIAVIAVLVLAASAIAYYVNRIQQDRVLAAQQANDQTEKEITLADFDIRLQVLGGATKRLTDYSEGILFINFWATWCGYCEKEMPDLIKLDRQMRAEGIGMVLAIDVNEKEPDVSQYLKEKGFSDLTVLLDLKGDAAIKFGIQGYPSTFVFKNGKFIDARVGMMLWSDMVRLLDSARKAV
ncbi:MAG TPA: TlpA disulfide reductase family protein [Bacillota bacterium]|nr:TlpA disulfide reductase family protein [Bacillota bacterium]HOG52344.1 TlpA disulfide reductase family protein [Bacillota bacterium]